VRGSRFKGHIEEISIGKKIGNLLATYTTCVLSGFGTSDAQSGFEAYDRKAAFTLCVEGSKTYVHEIIIKLARMGF